MQACVEAPGSLKGLEALKLSNIHRHLLTL